MAELSSDGGNGMIMPVAPMNYGYGGGFGSFGGDSSWIILFILLAMLGGFGGWGGFGGFGGMGAMMMGGGMLGYDFPWLMTGQQNINTNTNNGFRDAMINDNITSVRDGISALSTQLCGCCGDMQMAMANGFAGVNQNVSNGFANTNLAMCQGFNGVNNAIFGAQTAIGQQMNANEIANLNRSFAEQTANAQGFNTVNSGIADTRYTIASEACATRQTDTQNTQAILNAINGGIQSLKDQMCQDKIDAKDDIIAQLRQENLYARGQAAAESIYQRGQNSQDLQTAQILAGQAAIPGQVYTRFSECPVNTVPVFGNQRIFTCQGNNNPCGCGNFA